MSDDYWRCDPTSTAHAAWATAQCGGWRMRLPELQSSRGEQRPRFQRSRHRGRLCRSRARASPRTGCRGGGALHTRDAGCSEHGNEASGAAVTYCTTIYANPFPSPHLSCSERSISSNMKKTSHTKDGSAGAGAGLTCSCSPHAAEWTPSGSSWCPQRWSSRCRQRALPELRRRGRGPWGRTPRRPPCWPATG